MVATDHRNHLAALSATLPKNEILLRGCEAGVNVLFTGKPENVIINLNLFCTYF